MQLFGLNVTRTKTESRAALAPATISLLEQVRTGTGNIAANVTEQSAMSFAAVYRAIELRSETIASLPLQIIDVVNGNRQVNETDPLRYLLGTRPNESQTAFTFWQLYQMHIDLWGDGFALIEKNTGGRPIAFELMMPWQTEVFKTDGKLFYKFETRPGETYSNAEVLHTPGLGFDGIRGKSRIQMHRQTIAGGLAATKTNTKFWQNGAFFRGILQMPGFLEKHGRAQKVSADFQSTFGGENNWSVPVLHGGAEFKAISMPHRDAQYIEGVKFTVEEVARIFNVPLHKLKSMDGAKFNNVEQMQIEWVVDTVRPMVKRIENELECKLIIRGQNKRIKFNLKGLLRGDLKTRADYYKTLFYIKALTPNEVRQMEDLNPLPGGDETFSPTNMYSTEQLEEVIKNLKGNGE